MSMCRVIFCVVGTEYLLWPMSSLGKTLLAFALRHFVLHGQTCFLLQVSLDFLLLDSSPLWWKGHLLGVLVLEVLVDHHQFSSVQFSCSVVSDSLWPHESQHARPPCPSPTPRVYPTSCPLSRWWHPAISSSSVPFSSCPNPSEHQSLFQGVNSLHEVAKVLEFQL